MSEVMHKTKYVREGVAIGKHFLGPDCDDATARNYAYRHADKLPGVRKIGRRLVLDLELADREMAELPRESA